MSFSIIVSSITTFIVTTQQINTQLNDIQHNYTEQIYIIMTQPSITLLSDVTFSIIVLSRTTFSITSLSIIEVSKALKSFLQKCFGVLSFY